MVVLPEWQGVGIGLRFLEECCQMYLEGKNRAEKCYPTYFKTSHPRLIKALSNSKKWRFSNQSLYGSNKLRNMNSIRKSSKSDIARKNIGYGGHFRATCSFKYLGE
ncbi:hypothetical protein [Riemerella columbipharyngis]|uniref:hypothetical protein n=1 Tax=Riemerella columbipharyngis TaxID=1071918 RepID=UPI001C86AE93|nr:hypothetical protein [Riemerella columbipharyngis]